MEWNVSYCSQSDVVEKCLFGLIRDLYYSSTFIHKRTRIEHVLHNKNLVLLSSITIGQLLRLSCSSFIVSLIFMRDIFLMACVFVTITERRIRGTWKDIEKEVSSHVKQIEDINIFAFISNLSWADINQYTSCSWIEKLVDSYFLSAIKYKIKIDHFTKIESSSWCVFV